MERPPVDSHILETLNRLASQKAYHPRRGEQSRDIHAIQEALIGLGLRLTADGILGPQTNAALRRFQQGLGLKPTGLPTVETLGVLFKVLQDPSLVDDLRRKMEFTQPEPETEPNASSEGTTADGFDEPDPPPRGPVLPQTISDGAVSDISQDALDFTDYVKGLQQFLSAQETRPPLAIGITARWGQGKTSFMRMLETELKKDQQTSAESPWQKIWTYLKQLLGIEPKAKDSGGFKPLFTQLKTSYIQMLATKIQAPTGYAPISHWQRAKSFFVWLADDGAKQKNCGKKEVDRPTFVTSWFNPWLYSAPDQLWNAFVSNLSSCVLHALPAQDRRQFHRERFMYNLRKRVGFGPRFWFGLSTLVFTLLIFFYAIFSTIGGEVIFDIARKFIGDKTATALANETALPTILRLFGASVLASIFYLRVVKNLDLGLIDYLQKKDYSVKAGALVQFQAEMEMLARAVPDKLRVVIFIDDLDRCEEKILMEVISSLQVLTVSSKCYFVLGLDLAIVARQIEGSVLAQALEQTDEKQHAFQHGSGFRFLEKVIQARLSVPHYDHEQITEMVRGLLPKVHEQATTEDQSIKEEVAAAVSIGENPATEADEQEPDTITEPVVDAPEIGAALLKYGPEYFDNPRSLKRFMNSFRMHAHLATIVDNRVSTDQLARYFVLAERWPGLLDYFQRHPGRLDAAGNFEEKESSPPEEKLVAGLLAGNAGELFKIDPPLGGDEIVQLCDWYGFRFYRANRFLSP